MYSYRHFAGWSIATSTLLVMGLVGCKQQAPPSSAPPSAVSPAGSTPQKQQTPPPRTAPAGDAPKPAIPESAPALPPGHPPIQPSGESKAPSAPPSTPPAAPKAAALSVDGVLALQGITMHAPDTWKLQPTPAIPMGPVAVLAIPAAEGNTSQAEVRITHYPNMKGMPADANIDRWLSQVAGADGKPVQKDQAKIETFEHEGVRITLLDVCGKLTAAPGMAGGVIENGRLIAAILEHDAGPHFVKITGVKDVMDSCAAQAVEFIKSSTVAKGG
ncbi:MAG: hypothetical protein IT449_03095 [Phycisphaerales bacterium]|nr:hypothetical protein [Phycisphaerales bacterium]